MLSVSLTASNHIQTSLADVLRQQNAIPTGFRLALLTDIAKK
jgi:hypothetical protein